MLCRPMRQLWATITRSSIFVPSPMSVGAVGAAVDGASRADFYVGAQDDAAQLGREFVSPVDKLVSETIGPQYRRRRG